ncbi:shikimate kinase [Paucilactobacillus wasatchensis]|uniref:Shikimate kinase n=1 Tax=Paucilactobacillus wasatchensis TaxID=1335616 RepID=A0A0D0Y5U7_9LACO|nr:shikimate kinase [Paucilactobacillus wasatchensis]KIS03668.1 Shikimate kinase I [Paucilactobacillus wasatchensis]
MTQIILVGFMGAGKTTVGAQLALALNTYQRDLDQVIEQQLGESIGSFFAREGEPAFRLFETKMLRENAALDVILSTGGGIVMQAQNRDILKQSGAPVIYLKTQPEAILQRLRGNLDRPLLNQLDRESFLDLWQYREPLYQAVADFTIVTDKLTPTEITEQIINQLNVRKR